MSPFTAFGQPSLLPGAPLAPPEKPRRVLADIVRIQVDVHAANKVPSELKDITKSPAGGFPRRPGLTVFHLATRGAFHHESRSGTEERVGTVIVFDRLKDAPHARGKLSEGALTATDSKLWKVKLDVLDHQVRQIGAAGINSSEVLL